MSFEQVSKKGFTIIEILIVIAIIGILVSIILPPLRTAQDKALVASTQAELSGINTAILELYDDINLYPNSDISLCRPVVPANNEIDLSSNNSGLVGNGLGWSGWNGPYVSSVKDPWNGSYYLDEDYKCLSATVGCRGITDSGNDSSVIVSCGPNQATADGACAYDNDNIVYRLCDS